MFDLKKIPIVSMTKQVLIILLFHGFLYSSSAECRKEINTQKAPPSTIAKNPPAGLKKNNADIEKLVISLQKQYESTRSATFNFEQSYKHPFLSLTETSKGTVSYKRYGESTNKTAVTKMRVGKMLWSYTDPPDKQKKFYIDGNKFTYYSVRDKAAFFHNCYDRDTLSDSVAFLLGEGNLKTSFTIKPLDIESPNPLYTWLTLTPIETNSPVKKLYLGLNKQAQVMESLVEDPSGGKNHFKFSLYKVNPVIPDSMFVFTPPPGVKVQPAPNVVCPDAKAKPAPTPTSAPIKNQKTPPKPAVKQKAPSSKKIAPPHPKP